MCTRVTKIQIRTDCQFTALVSPFSNHLTTPLSVCLFPLVVCSKKNLTGVPGKRKCVSKSELLDVTIYNRGKILSQLWRDFLGSKFLTNSAELCGDFTTKVNSWQNQQNCAVFLPEQNCAAFLSNIRISSFPLGRKLPSRWNLCVPDSDPPPWNVRTTGQSYYSAQPNPNRPSRRQDSELRDPLIIPPRISLL